MINYIRQVNKHKAFCKRHPGIQGHSCGGLWHEITGTLSKGRHHAADISNDVHQFVSHHYGTIATVVAVDAAFVPGVDMVDLAAVGTVALGARIANRSTNDGSAPWSSQNLGANLTDTVSTFGTLGLVTGPAIKAEPLIGGMSTVGAAAVRARIAVPDLLGLGFSLSGHD
jgi:hypothetical protein